MGDKYTKIQHAHTTIRIEKDEIHQLNGTFVNLKIKTVNDK